MSLFRIANIKEINIIYLIGFSILASPFISLPISIGGANIHFFQLAAALIVVAFAKRILFFKSSEIFYYIFLLYVFIHSVFLIPLCSEHQVFIRRLVLFFVCYSLFLIILGRTNYFLIKKESMWKCIRILVLCTCIYGVYQFIARLYDLPFSFTDTLRGQYYAGDIRYIRTSSFFEEPAFFCQFLITCLYIFLFIGRGKDKFVLHLLVLNVVLSMSVSGYVCVFVLLLYVLTGRSRKIRGEMKTCFRKRHVVLLILIAVLLVSLIKPLQAGKRTIQRLRGELASWQAYQQAGQFINPEQTSGGTRIYGEMRFILQTLEEKPLFGYGIDYDKTKMNRSMALNVLTEVMVRWGAFGLLLFCICIIVEKMRYRSKNDLSFIVFMFLFFVIDGAIAKPVFWFCLSLALLFRRIEYLSARKANRVEGSTSFGIVEMGSGRR